MVNIQTSRSFQVCHSAKKIFQLDAELTLKMACAVISMFNASIKVTTEKMDEVEIYETALMFCEKYTHESVSDLMLCLKMAKAGNLGIIYNRFDTATFFEFYNEYQNLKYKQLEQNTLVQKGNTDGSVNTAFHTKMLYEERQQKIKENGEKYNEALRLQEVIELKRENNSLRKQKNGTTNEDLPKGNVQR